MNPRNTNLLNNITSHFFHKNYNDNKYFVYKKLSLLN